MIGMEVVDPVAATGLFGYAWLMIALPALGALLLAGLYALFGDVVMPTLNQRIKDMFNYAGALGG